jgi:Ca2+-binding EF-hand superfamily protein
MSSISAVSSAGSQAFAPRFDPAKMRDKLFAKVDSDGSGSVDKTELQGLADKVAKATGGDSVNTDDIFSKSDTDGDGKLSKDEFDSALKSIMPQPSSTVDFAQAHGAGGPPPGAGGPPPGGGGGGGDSSTASSADSASSSSSSATYDPLDTNEDGVVSMQERLAGALKTDLAKDLFNSMDTDSDGKISSSEADSFAQSLTSQVQANASTTASTSSSDASSGDDANAKRQAMGYSRLIEMVLQQYDQVASNSSSTSSSSSSVSVLA